jgi:hypothetical protein
VSGAGERAIRIERGGDTWYADRRGRIERPGLVAGSDSWRLVGAVERNNFGRVTRRYSLAEVLTDPGSIPWRFKNGAQRTFPLDFGHGSVREWCSPHTEIHHA